MSEQKKKIMLAAVGGVLLLFLFVGGCTAMSKSKPTPAPTPPSSSSSESSSSEESSSDSSKPEEKPQDDVVIPAALTRGEFAALLASKLNISVSSDTKNVFTDMENHFAKKPVLALLAVGVLSESDYNGSFAPKTAITRMEAIELLVKAMGGEDEAEKFTGNTSFADDAKIPQDKKGYVVTAEKLGITVAFVDNTFRPDAACVREEAVALIAKVQPRKLVNVDEKTEEEKPEDKKEDSSSKPSNSQKPTTPSTPSKPTTPAPTPAPAAKVAFELAQTAHTDTAVELKSSFENTTKLEWELKKDGRTVSLGSYVDGDPSKDRNITFTEKGSYELTLKATGKDGKIVTLTRKITVYPTISLNVAMPSKAKVDESVEVDLRIYGNADDRKIEWKLRRNGRTVDLDDYADERLYEDGGEISFNEDGRYELIATVKDKTGRTFSGKDSITVEQDETEQKPVPKPDPVLPTFSFDLPKTAHTDTNIALRTQYGDLSGYEVAWELYTLQGLESNWRAFVEGSLDKNGGSIRFTQAGSYELQAVVKNASGNVLRVKSGKIEVSPILSVEFSLPTEGKTDSSVRVRTKGNCPLPIVWTLTKDGREVAISDFTEGALTNAGGDIRFTEQGIYTLTASVTDGLNRTFTATQGINIYAAEKPEEKPNDVEQCSVGDPTIGESEGEIVLDESASAPDDKETATVPNTDESAAE